jgi:hypothetical protein
MMCVRVVEAHLVERVAPYAIDGGFHAIVMNVGAALYYETSPLGMLVVDV